MSSITMWYRLEPRARSSDISESLAARVADPLWFLARQWQVGEYRGEDGGSAISARLRGHSAPLTHVRLGAEGPSRPRRHPTAAPLEPEVEAEAFRGTKPTPRDAADAGMLWVSMLAQGGLAQHREAYIDRFPLRVDDQGVDRDDPPSTAFQRLLAGRVPDGRALFAELSAALEPAGGGTGTGTLPATPDLGDDRDAVETLARAWLAHWAAFAVEPHEQESAWVPAKFEYQFALGAALDDAELALEATEYRGDRIDWYQFHLGTEALGTATGASAIDRTLTPLPVTIPGNPASRFWEFEDGLVDFARIEAAPEDVARILHVEFALLYADDWLCVPLDLPVGSVFRTDSLQVDDTFGARLSVPPTIGADESNARWRLFHLSDTPGARRSSQPPPPVFLLPPALVSSLQATPVEEVLLARDEMANLAWGIERQVEGSRGRAFDRGESYQRRLASAPAPPRTALSYRLHGRVPDYWIPFMPVRQAAESRAVSLQRGSVRDPETGALQRPVGRLLAPDEPLVVDEEQAARSGVRLTRRARFARDAEGRVRLWMARLRDVGRGEGSSGVRFDRLK
jgi:hypothetical protein